jgi:predicted dehydrogenase
MAEDGNEDLRVGAIATGGLAFWEAQLFDEIEGVEVVAGADVDPDARAQFAEEFGASVYEDYAAMLEAEDLDAVNVVTPHTLHYEQTMDALERDLHVHLEKPMVTKVAHGHDIIERAAERDLVLQVGYQRHFHPGYREVRRLVEEGRIGDVHMVACYLAQDWISQQAGSWRVDPDLSGGGQLSDSGSHLLDAMLWTTDSEPASVAASMDYRDEDVDVNSALAATLEGPSGPITASIGVSGDGTSFEEGLTIWGTEGHIEYGHEEITVAEGDGQTYTAEVEGDTGFRTLTSAKLEAFVEAVRGEREVAVPGEYGLRVTALTEAAYEARDRGETVDVQQLVEDAK